MDKPPVLPTSKLAPKMPRGARRPRSNVASIWGNNTDLPNPEPDEEIVAALEGLLRLARDGRILGLHYACVEPGRCTSGGSAGKAEQGLMLVAITRAFLRYGRAAIADE